MNRSILYGLIVGLFFLGCNNDNTAKSEMKELKEVISDKKWTLNYFNWHDKLQKL